jgi:hypothetical protein
LGVFLIRKTLTSWSRQRRAAAAVRTTSPRPVPTAPLPLSKAAPPPCPNPAAVWPSDAIASFVHGERRPSSPLAVLHPWSVQLTSPNLLPVAGPPPDTIAPPHRKNAAAKPNFFPSPSTRSSGELSSPPPCPEGSLTVVGARPPPFALPPPLWHHRRPRRNARPGAVTAPTCAAPRRRGPHRSRPARQAQVARYAHGPRQRQERGPRALCAWAEPVP